MISISEANFKMTSNNNNNRNRTNNAPSTYKIVHQRGEISPAYDGDIQIIATKPASNF